MTATYIAFTIYDDAQCDHNETFSKKNGRGQFQNQGSLSSTWFYWKLPMENSALCHEVAEVVLVGKVNNIMILHK